jgi:hypothetical protein
MNEPAATPTQASVLYLRLAEFAAKPVVEQARMRAQLEAVVGGSLSVLPERDRLVLDAPDGLAIVVLGNALGALRAAGRCLDAAAVLPLCIGAGHGAVALVDGHQSVTGMLGDGLRSAAVAAAFAAPAQLLATQSFREAVGQQAPARQADLLRAGTFADASVRTHELFVMDRQAHARRRRRLAVAAAASIVVLLAAAFVGRLAYRQEGPFAPPAELALAITPGGEVFLDGVSQGTTPPLTRIAVRAGSHVLEVRHGEDPPLRLELQLKSGERLAVSHRFTPLPVVIFDVAPGGDVFVDGQARGRIPGLQRLELTEGTHAVEIRHEPYPPFKRKVQLKRGAQVTVKHVFAPAVLTFRISPGGNVFVNGALRGSLPALKRLELAPGRYAIEVRLGKHPPLQRTVVLKAGQQLVIQHEFKEKSFLRRLFGGQ